MEIPLSATEIAYLNAAVRSEWMRSLRGTSLTSFHSRAATLGATPVHADTQSLPATVPANTRSLDPGAIGLASRRATASSIRRKVREPLRSAEVEWSQS